MSVSNITFPQYQPPVASSKISASPKPQFSGKYCEEAIQDVLEYTYRMQPTCLRAGSKYEFTGGEILDRLAEAYEERSFFSRLFGRGVSVARIALHPKFTKDAPSLQAIAKGLRDLCQVGLVFETSPGKYAITPQGEAYLFRHINHDPDEWEPSQQKCKEPAKA